jgi:hypothetical protein
MDIDRMRLGWRCYEDNKRGLLIKEYTKNHTVTPKIYWKVIMRIYIEESVKTIESSLARDYEYCKEGLTRFNNSQLSTDIYDVNRRICNTPVAALSITDHLDMLEVCIDERERLKTRRSQIQVYNRILRKTCDKIIRFIPLYTKSLCSQYIIQNQSAKNRIIYRKLGGRSSVLKNLTSRDISLFPSKTIKKK